jgi:hypothetical protein
MKKATFLAVCTTLLLAMGVAQQQSAAPTSHAGHVGLPIDWSSRHLVTPRTVDSNLEKMAQHEPRAVFNWAYRNGGIGISNQSLAKGRLKSGGPKSSSQADWSFTLGTGKVAFNMSPAKYSFLISGTADCVNDYLVMGLDVTGSGTQPNLVGFKNLYVNPAGTGSCAGTAPLIKFAYNVTTATGGTVLTSPSMSLDGTKVAFVESATGAAYFHTLTIGSATEGSYSGGYSVVAPAANGSNALMTTTTISSTSTITNSSPWVNYSTDKAYVGDDAGNVYVINCVFFCGATVQTATLLKNVGVSTVLTGPVLDNNASSGANKLLVGGANGVLYTVDLTSCPSTCTVNSTLVGSALVNGGVVDPPVLDGTFDVLFVGAGNNGAGKGVLKEYDSGLNLKATVTMQTQGVDAHAITFGDAYYSNSLNQAAPPAGQLFACGATTGSGQPGLYYAAFGPASGTLSTSNPPVMGAATSINLPGNNNTPCNPLTELKNGATDRLFFSEPAVPKSPACTGGTVTDGCVVSYTINANTAGASAAPTAGLTRSEPGGTSGMIIDNVSSAAEASSIYFSTQNSSTCGTGTGVCAVKLTQSGLQ